MACAVQFFVLASVLAVVSCHPFKFGVGISAKSHAIIGAKASATVGIVDNGIGPSVKATQYTDVGASLGFEAYASKSDTISPIFEKVEDIEAKYNGTSRRKRNDLIWVLVASTVICLISDFIF